MSSTTINSSATARFANKPIVIFLGFWVILFLLYLPAAQAGRVGDFPGWVRFLTSVNFVDYINRSESSIPSLYQFTQIVTYFFYKLFGGNAWPWHLLYISMQAINAVLLWLLFSQLFRDARVERSGLVALSGALLFCVCPYISEVVVWEPAFHYLLGFMLMLGVLYNAQQYILTGKAKYAWYSTIIFFLSNYSLEIFYLTPFFVCTLCCFYRYIRPDGKKDFLGNLTKLVVPQVLLFAIYFILLRLAYHGGLAHIDKVSMRLNLENFSKGPKYLFHLLFFGRFFPQEIKTKVYHICQSLGVVIGFYSLIGLTAALGLLRFQRMSGRWKVVFFLFIWVLFSLALLIPLWFPETGLVIYDRYTYVLDAFFCMLISAIIANIFSRVVFIIMSLLLLLINVRYTHKANAYWQQSSHIVNNLVYTFPNDPTKKVLLLDLPECLDGVQMIGSRDDGEFKMMYNAIMPHRITNEVYDVEAFYLYNVTDGAHIKVLNDTDVIVTLNQWGSYWLYYGFGATSYENSDYKVVMRDVGHWYELILKHPINDYLMLYNVGDQWKQVDPAKKNVDQY